MASERKEPSCTIECRDLGYYDCSWYCNADDEDDAVNKAKTHASEAHNVDNIDEIVVRGKIKKLNPDLSCVDNENDPDCAITG